jgi:hypothetical protein
MPDPYFAFGPDPGGDSDTRYLTADQLGLGRLRRQENPDLDGEWVLGAVTPAIFAPVSFAAGDQEDAERKAIAWLENHLRTERRDLFHEDD